MNEPYVLDALRHLLAMFDRTGILSESTDVCRGLIGVGRESKEAYLSKYRDNYFALFTALSENEKPFRIEASLDSLVAYWKDAHERFISADDGIGMDGVVWSLIKTYHQETIYFICLLYRLFLLFPTDELYDIETKYPGLSLNDVHQVIYDAGLLTQKRISSLEEQIRLHSKKHNPFGGKILGIPWSGEEAIDSISDYFDDCSSLNMAVITKMGKEFRKTCRSRARDKSTTSEEKEIWARSVVNALNALYCQADRSKLEMINELTATYCAILEEEFMQVPKPICVKHLALDIDAADIFDDVIFFVNASPEGSTVPCTNNRFHLIEDMGEANLELYEKKMCLDCDVENCPYDIYLRKYQEDGVGIPGKYNFDPPKEEEQEPSSYLEDCHRFLCDPEIINFLDAVCMSLHIPPKWTGLELEIDEEKQFIDEHIKPKASLFYTHSEALARELTDTIKCLKNNEIELSNYIDSFLSPFYELSSRLYPISPHVDDLKRFVVFTCSSALKNCPFKDYPKLLVDSIKAVQSVEHDEDYDYTVDLIKEILDRAPKDGEQPQDRVFAAIYEIKTSLLLVEAALEAALLNAGIEKDYYFFEKEVGVNLGWGVTDIELYIVTHKTPQSFVSRIKKLGHRTRFGIKPDEDLYDYIRRYFSEEGAETLNANNSNDSHDIPYSATMQEESSNEIEPSTQGTSDNSDMPHSPIVISSRMQTFLDKAKSYFPDDHWWNDEKKQYAIFLKVLHCKVFRKEWSNNVRWIKLPIVPLKDGTLLTISQLKGALRDYDDEIDGCYRTTFENLLGDS